MRFCVLICIQVPRFRLQLRDEQLPTDTCNKVKYFLYNRRHLYTR